MVAAATPIARIWLRSRIPCVPNESRSTKADSDCDRQEMLENQNALEAAGSSQKTVAQVTAILIAKDAALASTES